MAESTDKSDETGCRDWIKDQYRPSYKGVRFEVDSDTKGGGRRLVRHEYPSRESGDTEDMGRATDVYQVTGYVTGDDAKERVHDLFLKCSDPGPGLLILPMRQPCLARCGSVASTFVGDQLGRFEISMEFIVEQGEKGGLFFKTFSFGKLRVTIDHAADQINTTFSINFDTVRRAFSALAYVPAVARLRAAEEIVRAGEALAFAAAGVPIAKEREAAKVEYAIRTMREQATRLAFRGQKPNRYEADMYVADQEVINSGLSGIVSEALRRLADHGKNPELAHSAMLQLANFQAVPVDEPFGIVPRSIRAERVLSQEVASLVRQHALIRLAQSVAQRTYPTRADAVTARGRMAQLFEVELRNITDPSLSKIMSDVAAEAASYLVQLSNKLPVTIKVKTQWSMPACVVATALYNDASKDRALIAHNGRNIHPLFMPDIIEAPNGV